MTLEPSLCDLHDLEKMDVKDNPLERPPASVCRQGHMHMHVHPHMHLHLHLHVELYICICIHIHIHIYIHMYMYISPPSAGKAWGRSASTSRR